MESQWRIVGQVQPHSEPPAASYEGGKRSLYKEHYRNLTDFVMRACVTALLVSIGSHLKKILSILRILKQVAETKEIWSAIESWLCKMVSKFLAD